MNQRNQFIGIIVQARMGSSRLPNKVLMKIDGERTILDSVLEQLQFSKKADLVIIATTNLEEDDVIESALQNKNIQCFRGNNLDVLDRYYQCAKEKLLDVIVRITCDNPLIDPELIDIAITKYLTKKFDFVTNCFPRTFPFGTEIEIFSFSSLQNAWKNACNDEDREHVTKYFYENASKFRICNLKNSEDCSNIRYTVDTIKDLENVKKIVKKLKKRPILTKEIVEILRKNP
jgi:spore coat polysaccharide biosynthesis protein SpsF